MSADGSSPVIEVRGVRKVYRVYHGHGRGWLKSRLMPWAPVSRFAQESTALHDVDLTIARGEALGILGRNGSGKSTLLRIVAGMTAPTEGSVDVRGQLRCIMATGIGFSPRLTGRENIVYGSIAMGIPRRTAIGRMDDIAAFAELTHDLDKPTMYYSRGMRARLALAVALQETPEVLILDEALAAGDAGFTDRCRERIDEICASGNTVLLATHSLALMERACTRAIVLDRGRIVADADPAAAVAAYRAVRGHPEPEPEPEPESVAEARPQIVSDGAVELVDAYLCGADGHRRDRFVHGERLELHAILDARQVIERPRLRLELFSADAGVRVTQLGTFYLDAGAGELSTFRPARLEGRQELVVAWPENPLGSGDFYWCLALYPWAQKDRGTVVCHLRASPVCRFASVAFPDRSWRRRSMIEVASEVALEPISEHHRHEVAD
jgi:ABC-type polysaccharide/polyol phosphate transport system ATPase subunit